MAYDDLRAWIAALERAGELKTIRTEVDPILEIAEITDRVSKNVGAGVPPGRPTNAQQPGGPAWATRNHHHLRRRLRLHPAGRAA